MILEKHESKFVNYFIVYIAIALSGIQLFDGNPFLIFSFFMTLLFLFNKRNKKFNNKVYIVCIIVGSLVILQFLLFGGFEIVSVFGIILNYVLIPYMLIEVIGLKFFTYFKNIIYYYAIISIIFWIGINFLPGFFDLTVKAAYLFEPLSYIEVPVESFILYNIEYQTIWGLFRNSGPFHEPGAFALFLVLALAIIIVQSSRYFNKISLLIIFALATTFSTAGYLSLIIYFAIPVFKENRNYVFKFIFILISVPLIYVIYNQEFVSNKLEEHYISQSSMSLYAPTSGRILGARKSLVVLERYPLTGRGLSTKTQPFETSDEAGGYGWIYWVSRLGVPAGFLFLYYFWRFFYKIAFVSEKKSIHFLLTLMVLLSLAGQKHTSSYIFLAIFFSGLIYSYNDYKEQFLYNN